mgnify:CR=1 FL=1|tara:strand:+ start:1114 stop:1527 length:414 start_codon:yes stop_codon:yes gene_type:complete
MAVYKLLGYDATNVRSVLPSASDTAALDTTLDVEGGIRLNSRDISGTYNVLGSDFLLAVNSSGDEVTINLQSASNNAGRILIIKDETGQANVNNITINRNGSDMIDGQTSFTINTSRTAIILVSTGSTWLIVSKYTA